MVASFTHCHVTAAALVVLFCPMDGPLQLSDSVIGAWDHTVCTLCALRFELFAHLALAPLIPLWLERSTHLYL